MPSIVLLADANDLIILFEINWKSYILILVDATEPISVFIKNL